MSERWEHFHKIVNEKVQASIATLGPKTSLRDACEYALTNGGKRFRPILVYLIADSLDPTREVMEAALAVEYCHTASLIADDLPCMDDDDLRRGKSSLHKAFDEQTALLASYALIAAAYGLIYENAARYNDGESLCRLALECASRNTGVFGAAGGQHLDLDPPSLTEEMLEEVLRKKTVSLFEISFVFGWLFGGGDPTQLEKVKKASYHFGMAFQIADDIDDQEQDLLNERKINVANVLGLERAEQLLHQHIQGTTGSLQQLNLVVPEFKAMLDKIVASP